MASESLSNVPRSTSSWQSRSYSSAEPSHQWISSGSVSRANSSTQAISFWFLVGASAADAVVSLKGWINSSLVSATANAQGNDLDVPGHSAAPGGLVASGRFPPPPMRFYEYESRKIVERAGIPVTKYGICNTPAEARAAAEEIGGSVVIKSQVLTGGRMKAGGVKFADSPEEAEAHAAEILELEINGQRPRGVLVDPKAQVAQEYYAGVVWDGTRKRPMMLFSDMGGIDIEEVAERHPEHVGRGHLSNLLPIPDFQAKQVIAQTGVTGSELNRATPILARLAQLMRDCDMTLAEINPLARLEDGSFVALDAHMEMEDEARPRQRKLLAELGIGEEELREPYEPSEFERNVKAIDSADHRGVIQGKDHGFHGNLGLVIGAGGGSLTLTDAVRSQGGDPANYTEIGGNPSVAKARGLAREVLRKDGVEKIAVMMSIVSNTRVDIVARGVIKACLELGKEPGETIAIFRIPGAWEEEGFKILERYGVEYCDRSVSMWEAAGRAVAKIQGMSILLDPELHLHRSGHHRPRGRQPDPGVPRLRLQGGRRRDPGAQGARGSRRARVRHRPAGRRRGGVRAQRLRGHRPPRVHQGRGVRGPGGRYRADRDRHRADPAPRRGADGRAGGDARGADHRPELPRRDRPRGLQDGRHRRPGEGRGQGVHAWARWA